MNGPGASLPFLFGPYELLVRLGHGGMGQVYLARRTTVAGSDSLCVVKTLKPELVDDPEYVGRFLDEVRTVMQLRHSSISHVFDAGQQAGTYYMAMEHLSGVTARDVWSEAQRGRLDVGLALLLVEDVLAALAYAHAFKSPLTGEALSVVHRDASPHNVIVTFEGEVKLIDFGLAESVLKQEHTESQVVMGKITYMSPEQARGEDVDGACDQFAAAVMLYELVSGERFYGARNNSEVWKVVGFGGFRPDRFAELPAPLASILERALAADRRDRFPDCGAFQAALEALHAQSYPHATRSRLRAFMQEAFAKELREQQDEVVRSAAVATEVQQYTQSVSASRPSAPSASLSLSSGVWASPSSPEVPAAPEVTTAVPRSEPSESLRVPRSRAPLVVAALAAVVALVILGAVVLGGSAPDAAPSAPLHAAADGVASPGESAPVSPATATTGDAQAGEALADESAGERPSDEAQAKPPEEAATALAEDVRNTEARPTRVTTTKRPRSEAGRRTEDGRATTSAADEGAPPSASDAADEKQTTTREVAPTPPEPTASMTNAEALDVVQGCKLGCAPRVLALPGVKDGSVLHQKPNAVVLNCARLCLAH